MTWNEVRLASLQKMFSSEGTTINEHDETLREYLAAMPQAANEGANLLLAAGFGLRSEKLLCENGETAADLETQLADLYAGDPLELYRCTQGGGLEPLRGARLTAGRYLEIPGGGPVKAVYTRRPAAFTALTPQDTRILLDEQGAVLLPLYMASQLYKDDDISMATQYRNEFEAALERLRPGRADLLGGGFSGVSGWT